MSTKTHHMLRVPMWLWTAFELEASESQLSTASRLATEVLFNHYDKRKREGKTVEHVAPVKEPTKLPVSPVSEQKPSPAEAIPAPAEESIKKDYNKTTPGKVYDIRDNTITVSMNDPDKYRDIVDFYAFCVKSREEARNGAVLSSVSSRALNVVLGKEKIGNTKELDEAAKQLRMTFSEYL